MEKKKSKTKVKVLIASVVGLTLVGVLVWVLPFAYRGAREAQMLYVYPDTTLEALSDTLEDKLGETGSRVSMVLKVAGIDIARRSGAYRIEEGETPIDIARKLRNGIQSPIKFTFNNVRTNEQFADRVAKRFMMSKEDMLNALNNDSVCAKYGKTPATICSVIFPDSYEFYWNVSPEKLIDELAGYSKRFWTEDRLNKAKALGLTPEEVVIVGSIVEEESAKRDEHGKIGRLYVNRVQRGIPLQADPTVKYALGDFGIRRITLAMTKCDNPYNTYRYAGLPPGPIRFVSKVTIDNILNSDPHDYIYMCAKEDFSGYHNFASTLAEHNANARRYHKELNRRGIR